MGLVSYIISPSCPFSFYGVREQVAHEAKKIQNKHILNYWGPKKNSTLGQGSVWLTRIKNKKENNSIFQVLSIHFINILSGIFFFFFLNLTVKPKLTYGWSQLVDRMESFLTQNIIGFICNSKFQTLYFYFSP